MLNDNRVFECTSEDLDPANLPDMNYVPSWWCPVCETECEAGNGIQLESGYNWFRWICYTCNTTSYIE